MDPVRLVLARIASHASGPLAPELLAVIGKWSYVEWERLLATALRESLLTWVVNRIISFGLPCPVTVMDEYHQIVDNGRAAAYYGTRLSLYVLSLMEQAGIEARIIKGHFLGQYLYGDAGLRDSRDVDLMVQPADVARAAAVLAKAGFTPQVDVEWFNDSRFLKSNREASFKALRGAFEVDLHWALSYRWVPELLSASELFSTTKGSLTVANKTVPWFEPVTLFLIQASNIISSQHIEMKAYVDLALIFDKLTSEQLPAVTDAFERDTSRVALHAISSAMRSVFGRSIEGLAPQYPPSRSLRRMTSLDNEIFVGLVGTATAQPIHPTFWSNARFTVSWPQMSSLVSATYLPSMEDYLALPTSASNSRLLRRAILRRFKKLLWNRRLPIS